MKKGSMIYWIVGLCAFVALMLSGTIWLLNLIEVSWGFLGTLEYITHLVLVIAVFLSGWVWLSGTSMNKTLKIVLQVLFIIFAVLAIAGIIRAF